ncbi:hypothetical protein DP149_11750 [Clostridium tetani]|uniref:Uncharacterized protein n=2 Tax=Clostridium tetani TaxID=1513 RepID=Q891E1_CLOTE|nr:hypothetical protein [Clostridium tetani]AAO36904.1 hypothetical protein CTC_02438 [Clostridium tetani E88]KGI38592.1 hypothetical protein KY52_05500 [Clostridium tetani]KGI44165.1 hypothetical protein KY54_08900 [Clostridium tetani]KHO30911.1 hypothetical protein OR63_12330 [Clostridium tetani]KIG20911.1 hypothetical protein RS78_06620 [Clostridium tetani]
MKKVFQKVFYLLLLFSILVFSSEGKVYAHVNEQVNNTKENAVSLTYNTVNDSIKFRPKVLYGCEIVGTDDEDWYKVYLPTGTQTLSIYASKPLIAQVYTEDNRLIFQGSYGLSTKVGQKFQTEEQGTYYVKIKSANNENLNYYIMMGAPWYKAGSYTYNHSGYISVGRFSKESDTISFSLSSKSEIPDTAIVTGITTRGKELGSAYGRVRSLKANNQFNWIGLREFTFNDNNMYSSVNPIKLKQGWQFKHSISAFDTSSYSVKPSITFEYMAEDDI